MKKIYLFLFLIIFQSKNLLAMAEQKSLISLTDFAQAFFASRVEYASSNTMRDGRSLAPYPESFIPKKEFVETIKQFKNVMNLFLDQQTREQLLLSEKKESRFAYIQKLDLTEKFNINGDIHASAHSLLRNMLNWNSTNDLKDNFMLNTPLIFTGDYASRGQYGVEVWYLLMKLKIANPDKIFPTKGNHEIQYIAEKFGFKDEVCQKYGDDVFEQMLEVFTLLPSALIINNTAIACHGIIPTDNKFNSLISIETIQELNSQPNYSIKIIPAFKDLYFGEIIPGTEAVIKAAIKRPDKAHSVSQKTIELLLAKIFLRTLLRGHDHNEFAVSVAEKYRKIMANGYLIDTNSKPIKQLINLYSFPAYTFMSCPEGQGGPTDNPEKCNMDGFATITTFKDWVLAPFKRNLPKDRNGKYVHVHTTDHGFEFSWEERPHQ